MEQKGEWPGFTNRREWPLDSSLEGELTGFVLSRQSTLTMSRQPAAYLPPHPAVENQEISFLATVERLPCSSEASGLSDYENYVCAKQQNTALWDLHLAEPTLSVALLCLPLINFSLMR